jgi:hypothetical protein
MQSRYSTRMVAARAERQRARARDETTDVLRDER